MTTKFTKKRVHWHSDNKEMYWCATWQVIWHTLWKPEGNLLFGRRHRWEDDTKMDLKEIGGWGLLALVMNRLVW